MDSQDNYTQARGKLFIVATPIGNLSDMSYRAVETLKKVDWIAAEDTRTSRRLLDHYDVDTPTFACHEHNEAHIAIKILERLNRGESGALISDAGTPLINDPGYRLVRQLRQAGCEVVPIPGACSPIVALCASGLATDQFTYMGFLARSGGTRKQQIQQIAVMSHSCVFLESPRRLLKTLKDLSTVIGSKELVVGRELTKLYEEFVSGTVTQVIEHFESQAPRGEIVVMVGAPLHVEEINDETILKTIQAMQDEHLSPSSLAKTVAQHLHVKRSHVYQLMMAAKS
ncbi:MAG: 16S rRNA (cytidine(1402)-2'-O)-methyltransferase [Mariprofundaceae bacterium]|nr:16S rRNA (cytidine(1402)-2'-O)-methyltransferase [Mariprofundaceae bacterium]